MYKLNGKLVSRKEFLSGKKGIDFEGYGAMIQASGAWPQYSDAVGVHSCQRKEAYEQSVALGVPTQFDVQGRAVFESRGHRKKYLRKAGFYDRDAGYGDPGPTH